MLLIIICLSYTQIGPSGKCMNRGPNSSLFCTYYGYLHSCQVRRIPVPILFCNIVITFTCKGVNENTRCKIVEIRILCLEACKNCPIPPFSCQYPGCLSQDMVQRQPLLLWWMISFLSIYKEKAFIHILLDLSGVSIPLCTKFSCPISYRLYVEQKHTEMI